MPVSFKTDRGEYIAYIQEDKDRIVVFWAYEKKIIFIFKSWNLSECEIGGEVIGVDMEGTQKPLGNLEMKKEGLPQF